MCYNKAKYGGVMSKQLTRILSFCALAVLFPFVVVGSALTFTQAVEVTLSIAQAGVTSLSFDEPTIYIAVDGERQEANTISGRKNTVVDLVYEGEGYYFHGWYEGNADAIDLEKDMPIAGGAEDIDGYVISKNVTLTAMRDVQTYNITYTGEYLDGTAISVPKAEGVEYGSSLVKLASNKSGALFIGWKVKDTELAPTQTANFEATKQAQEVELVPVWGTDISYSVQYSVVDASAEKSTTLTFAYETGFDKYTKTRDGYTFAGLTILVNGKETGEVYVYSDAEKDYIYNGKKLSEKLFETNDVQVCAYWESVYGEATFNFMAKAYYEDPVNGKAEWEVYTAVDGQNVAVCGNSISMKLQDSTDASKNLQLTDNFMDYFMSAYAGKEIVTSQGQTVAFSGLVNILCNGETLPIDMINNNEEVAPEDYSIGDVFEMMADWFEINSFEGKTFSVYFIYE